MNDERFERDLREVLLEVGQGPVAPELRQRAAELGRRPIRDGAGQFARIVGGLAAAVVIVAVAGALLVNRATVGPRPNPSSSPSASSSPTPTPEPLGESWASVPYTGDLAGASIVGILAYHDAFIAVGETLKAGTPWAAGVWTSPDGLHWTRRNLPDSERGPSGASSVVAGPGGPLVFGTTMNVRGETIPVVWSSPDSGSSWRQTELPAPPRLDSTHRGSFLPSAVASGAAGVVATVACSGEAPGPPCPSTSYLWQSPDGVRWRLVTFPEPYASATALIAGGPGFVAAGARNKGTEPAIWTSPDGVGWALAGELPDSGRAANGDTLLVNALVVAPNGILALSAHQGMSVPARAWVSMDGRTWRLAADLTDEWFGLYSEPIATPLGFLAAGYTAPGVTPPAYPDPFEAARRDLLRSPDGLHWEVLHGPPETVGGIAVGTDRLVVVTAHAFYISPASLVPSSLAATPEPTPLVAFYVRNDSSAEVFPAATVRGQITASGALAAHQMGVFCYPMPVDSRLVLLNHSATAPGAVAIQDIAVRTSEPGPKSISAIILPTGSAQIDVGDPAWFGSPQRC